MSYTVLARRYRSNTFDEVVGQAHVAQTLKKAIASSRIAHAYLFCGTRGTGKTSMARILAKALNCQKADGPTTEPCGKCDSCQAIARGDDIDVIEIDAASNTGVDNIRELIENAQYRPARGRFKVYIIDEVHMLSKNAFNALLKTLEEPPEHVKFILATTEPEKVLATILSRCQRYDFRNIPAREIAGHLKEICKTEKIKADDDALLLVARAGAGSMRDALSLLDRLLSVGEKHLTAEMIEQLLGLPRSQMIFDLAGAIGQGDAGKVLTLAETTLSGGLTGDTLAASLIDHLRNLLILRTCGRESGLVEVPGLSMDEMAGQAERFDPTAPAQDIAVLEELRRQMRQSQAGRALLDATLVRMALAEQFSSVAELLSQLDGNDATRDRTAADPSAQKKKPPALIENRPVFPSPREIAARVVPEPVAFAGAEPDPSNFPPAEPQSPVEEDDDDGLPRPGKVWEAPAKSLSTLMREHALSQKSAAGASAVPSTVSAKAPAESNVEPADPNNLPAVWQALLALLAENKGQMLSSALAQGQFVGIEDGRAIIRYAHDKDTFARMLEKNGKKEQLRNAFTRVLGYDVGIKFEVEPPPTELPAGGNGAPAAPAASTPRPPGGRMGNIPEAEPSAPAANRLTPELRATLEADPLIKAVLQELGGTIVKVE